MSTRTFGGICAVVVALLVAGCGSSNSGGSSGGAKGASGEPATQTSSLSKKEFIEQADSLCETTRAKFGQELSAFLESKNFKPSDPNQEAVVGEAVDTLLLPTYEGLIGEIESLGIPEEDQEQVTTFIAALEKGLDEVHEEPIKIIKSSPFKEPKILASEYGMVGCAESFS